MNCANVRRLLSAYCDAELPSERRVVMRHHLHNCEGCTAALEAFKKLSVLTAKLADLRPSASLWQELAPKLMAALAAPGQSSPEELIPLAEESQKRPSPKRSFKPVVEGLEDRYPLSDLLYAAGTTIVFSVVEPVRAYLRTDEIWAAMADSAAGFTEVRGAVASVTNDFGNPEGGGEFSSMDSGLMWALA